MNQLARVEMDVFGNYSQEQINEMAACLSKLYKRFCEKLQKAPFPIEVYTYDVVINEGAEKLSCINLSGKKEFIHLFYEFFTSAIEGMSNVEQKNLVKPDLEREDYEDIRTIFSVITHDENGRMGIGYSEHGNTIH